MSKNSAKQNITQLKEWLSTRSTGGTTVKKERKFSKADHYKKVNNRYGSKKSN
tara:strand:+ start:76 stop:234 length:159 start_codon:yes stop_codon:yes gene_type:complete